ncbi:hypothetical protein F441_19359 [Phytophthora nicotianae CJ01A1]|uniref:RxLR effector protein n=6 Tax=Phytophthora nicotianae TaxID=4792 RepID=W2QZR8_PHYN3|nr:hypothetical protein PPTG_05602 [Phytophthora nicotianae INRA-310]ETI33850.1 hypothetical protein F443_19541 [Phytophthora nicotianae P1569]ETK74193.1 hypothetical protein L915_18961 [Phytophthora nicotianae]ETO62605.1 hypothetical protein F444_19494 [Phytophthora nicotianae P1976]ETP03721.1 hypothetical protein F441_19359 [Phytophthora nicotianae CJ01A1]ETP31872.1 hypothetical protein F442_19314 [Phytophthora nicotianae P10297]KUF76180.1 hypothetical protein AM587_10014731 [Phytophthora n
MRLYYIAFLVAATFLATTTSGQAKNKEIDSLRASAVSESDIPIKRFLRKRETTHNDDDERAFNVKVPVKVKKFGGKLKRLSVYNVFLVLARKDPQWVKEHFPQYFEGFRKFYNNRMTDWGKYG